VGINIRICQLAIVTGIHAVLKEHKVNKHTKSLRSLVLMLAVGICPALLSSQAKPSSLRIAQVNGVARLVATDPVRSVAEITMASADSGTLKTKLAFKSTQTVVRNDEVDIIGNLTLALVEHTATCCNPGEDYSGSVYGERVRRNITHQIVFVFPREQFSEPSTTGDFSATALIDVDHFPELLRAIYAANWPAVAQDEHCEMPGNMGEDYAGPSCTGTVANRGNTPAIYATNWLAVAQNEHCEMPSNIGEDYAGLSCRGTVAKTSNSDLPAGGARGDGGGLESDVPVGNQIKVVLSLRSGRKGAIGTASFSVGSDSASIWVKLQPGYPNISSLDD
jgi:hypothetical protein